MQDLLVIDPTCHLSDALLTVLDVLFTIQNFDVSSIQLDDPPDPNDPSIIQFRVEWWLHSAQLNTVKCLCREVKRNQLLEIAATLD